MEKADSGLLRFVLVSALCVVLAVAGWYIVQLRAENAALRGARTRPAEPPAEPAAAADTAPTGPGARSLSPQQRSAMIDKLRTADSSTPNLAWFATVTDNPEAAAFQRALHGVFEEAGWQVRSNAPVTFRLKPGNYLFVADENPPPYVSTALDAFDAAGIALPVGRGYRAFYAEKKRDNANWNGFEMTPEQTYVVVIGPQPPQ